MKNTGDRDGKESILVYSSDLVATMIPDVKRVRAFEKIALRAGESRTVTFEIPAKDLSFASDDGKWHLEEGDFRISAGSCSQLIHCKSTAIFQ